MFYLLEWKTNKFRSEEEIIRRCHMLSSVSEPSTGLYLGEKREHS